MAAYDKNKSEEQEGFVRGYEDIPDDDKLREMSYAELASLSSHSEKGSARQRVIEQEMARRTSVENAKLARSCLSFWAYPITKTLLAIFSTVVAAIILWYLGLK